MMATHSEFDHTTSAFKVATAFPLSIKGRVFLITGVSLGGIGGATAKALASQSPKLLILTGRTNEKVDAVISEIQSAFPKVACRFLQLDLSSQSSVRKAASEVLAYEELIDVLINNAGVATVIERTLSEDGIEVQFATNHVGHFLFTNLIMPKLITAAKASSTDSVRIINLSSNGHRYSPVRFSDINWEKTKDEIPADEWPDYEFLKARVTVPTSQPYIPMAAYGASKTANILFTVSLDQRLKSLGIRSLAVHPGVINTELMRHMSQEDAEATLKRLADSWKTLEQGASTTLVAALDPGLLCTGEKVYMSDCQFADAKAWASDLNMAEKLWAMSEDLVGEKFGVSLEFQKAK